MALILKRGANEKQWKTSSTMWYGRLVTGFMLKASSTQKCVLLIVTTLGGLTFSVQKDGCAESDTRWLFSETFNGNSTYFTHSSVDRSWGGLLPL